MQRLPILVLPLAILANVAGGQTLQEKRSGPSAPGDTLPKVVSREFEIYGPTRADVGQANAAIGLAISQFQVYLGEHPRKMAFVLFRSAADAGRYDPKPLTRRGLPIVPWILPANPPGTGAARSDGDFNPDPLEHEAAHHFLAAFVEHALGSGQAAPAADDPRGSAAPGAARGVPVPAPHPDIAALPDWLEEAVATLCESPAFQNRRIEYMRARLDQRIPFAEFLEMRRPGSTAAGKKGKAGPAPKTGGVGASPDRAAIFSAEAVSLARFIARREEDRFIGTIVEGVLSGRTVGDVLNKTQDLYSKPDALEKQWLEWMQGSTHSP